MSLIVEDGTGLATAEAYVSVSDLKACRSRGGLTIPAGTTDADLELALIRATAAIDGLFGNQWPAESFRAAAGQALDWPRSYAWDKDWYPLTGVPAGVKSATCEAALVEINSVGALTKKAETGIKSDTTGPITTVYAGATRANATIYPAIKQALARIVRGGSLAGRR